MNQPMSLLTRIVQNASVIYLIIPYFFFSVGWLRWPFSMLTLVAIAIAILFLVAELIRSIWKWSHQQPRNSLRVDSLLIVLSILVLWLALSGAGGFGYQNFDYLYHNALLKDLIDQNWPLSITIDEKRIPLVYYIGYYLPAAAVGKLLGWHAANFFQYFWTLTGLILSFAWFVKSVNFSLSNQPIKTLLFTLFFALTGGFDFWTGLIDSACPLSISPPFCFNAHREWWVQKLGMSIQYSSTTTLLFWVPQHAIPGWISIGLLTNTIMHPDRSKTLLAVASSVLWSPFIAVGTIPYLIIYLYLLAVQSVKRKWRLSKEMWFWTLTGLWLSSIATLYIQSNQLSSSVNFTDIALNGGAFKAIFIFILFEFGIVAFLVLSILGISLLAAIHAKESALNLSRWQQHFDEHFDVTPRRLLIFLVSLTNLIFIPFVFLIGSDNAFFSNFVLRSSIPSLFIFFSFVGCVVFKTSHVIRQKFKVLYFSLVISIVLSCFTSLAEIGRSVKHYQFGPHESISISATVDLDPNIVRLRLGQQESIFFSWIGKSTPDSVHHSNGLR